MPKDEKEKGWLNEFVDLWIKVNIKIKNIEDGNAWMNEYVDKYFKG